MSTWRSHKAVHRRDKGIAAIQKIAAYEGRYALMPLRQIRKQSYKKDFERHSRVRSLETKETSILGLFESTKDRMCVPRMPELRQEAISGPGFRCRRRVVEDVAVLLRCSIVRPFFVEYK